MIVAAAALACALTMSQAIDNVTGHGEIYNLINVPGTHIEQILVYTYDGFVVLMPFKDGCAVAPGWGISNFNPDSPLKSIFMGVEV